MRRRLRRSAILALMAVLFIGGTGAAEAAVISSIDLSEPFRTLSHWRFIASQGPAMAAPYSYMDGTVPGVISLCISKDQGRSCEPDMGQMLRHSGSADLFSEPHYLGAAKIVRPDPRRALLFVQLGSLFSGDGDQLAATRVLAYDRGHDRFVSIYAKSTWSNNNEEVRYMADGPLRGDMISAEPTETAPFGYWITVNALTPSDSYRAVLHYRSATRYGDGNPLSVIDSEMPIIELRLGLWRAGEALPVPKGPCPRPHLVRMALWCQ